MHALGDLQVQYAAILVVSVSALANSTHSDTAVAAGQEQGTAAPASTQGTSQVALEEVVVTAQRRTESLARTAIAVTKLDGEKLRENDVRSIADMQYYVPGLVFSQNGASFTTLRGVGTSQPGSAVEAGVATNLDGVYIGRTSAAMPYFDLGSIEVLRGPQGTLYGRNATGGAINIISARPTEDLQAGLDAIAGDYSRRRIEGFVSGPLTDTTRGRVAMVWERRDSYLDNVDPAGPDMRDDEVKGARGTFVFEPDASDLSVSFTADYQETKSAGMVPQFVIGGLSVTAPQPALLSKDPTEVTQSLDNFLDRDNWGVNLTIQAPVAGLSFRSITAYRDHQLDSLGSLSPSNDPRFLSLGSEEAWQFSQEFQLLSDDDSRIKWVAGLYYYKESVLAVYETTALLFDVPVAPGFYLPLGYQEVLTQDFDNESIAAFGQLTYPVTERLRLTGGVRYTKDYKDGTGGGPARVFDLANTGFFPDIPVGGDASVDDSWDAFTPKFGVEYDVSTGLVYASATRGYKPGNSNLTVGSPPVDPEFVWAYEAGYKARLLENRLQANFAAYYYDYTDMQVFGIVQNSSGSVTAAFQNASSSTITGFDFELLARPIENLDLNLSYGYLDTEFGDFLKTDSFTNTDPLGLSGVQPKVLNLEGNTLPLAPKHTLNMGASYRFTTGSFAITPRVEYTYRSEMYFSEFNHPETMQPSYDFWNARLEFAPVDGNWRVALFGRNLGNAQYLERAIEGSNFNAYGFYAAPETYGVEFGLRL